MTDLERVLGSRDGKTDLGGYVRDLAGAGLHVVLVEPMGKAPLDMRTPATKREDDLAAQEQAKAAGNPLWGRAKAPAGVHLATADTARLDAYVAAAARRYGVDTVNLGVEVGRSGLVIVDADTGASVEAFRKAHADNGQGDIAPTVASPGKQNASGEWVHENGGHFWFTVPEVVELPGGTGAYTVDGWTAYYADRQLLIPPSVRAEGPYTWRGGIRELPAWLLDRITAQAEVRATKARERLDTLGDSPIDEWAAGVEWAELLEPRGWVNSGRVSNCGCAEWTAPGPHDSPKSATAHDLGCTHEAYDGTSGHAPLHVWTDNPPEGIARYVAKYNTRTMSKMQYVAWTDHAGDIDAACTALGIPYSDGLIPPVGEPLEVPVDDRRVTEADVVAAAAAALDNGGKRRKVKANLITLEQLYAKPPLEPLVDEFVYRGTLSILFGEPGVGKSFVALDWALRVATGTPWHGRRVTHGTVVYLAGEGTEGLAERIKAWASRWYGGKPIPTGSFLVYQVATDLAEEPTETSEWVYLAAEIANLDPAPVYFVVDTLARYTLGHNESDSQEMSRFIANAEAIIKVTGAAGTVVHHNTRGTDHLRGSTALPGGVESEFFLKKAKDQGETSLVTTKQKNHAEHGPVDLRLMPCPNPQIDSMVIDVRDETTEAAEAVRLPNVKHQYQRLAAFMWNLYGGTDGGATEGAIKAAWKACADPALCYVPNPKSKAKTADEAFRNAFNEALRHLERKGFVEHPTGASGNPIAGRYMVTTEYASALDLPAPGTNPVDNDGGVGEPR